MKLIKLFVCSLCFFANLALAETDASGEETIGLLRATLSVSDMEKSLLFYRDILGFTVRSVSPYNAPNLRRMFHVPEGVVPEFALLDASPEQPRALGLVYAPGVVIDRKANMHYAPAIVFNTNSLDLIHKRMLAQNVEVLQAPAPLLDFTGKAIGREAAYYDPDGARIVLFEVSK